LVLLAVVLIVALVSVALLGFFPGMASDAQITQSQAYWKSASPISIVESGALYSASWNDINASWPYLRIMNTGSYPIRITKVLGGQGQTLGDAYCSAAVCGAAGHVNISDWFYMAPGEEKYFHTNRDGFQAYVHFILYPTGQAAFSNVLPAYSSGCQNSSVNPGMLLVNNFGFEYIEYVEGQQITKRQIGTKPLVIKCQYLP